MNRYKFWNDNTTGIYSTHLLNINGNIADKNRNKYYQNNGLVIQRKQ